MAYIYYTGDADSKRSQYINDIERARRSINKNFREMDLDNASAKDEIEKLVDKMKRECDSLISTLRGI